MTQLKLLIAPCRIRNGAVASAVLVHLTRGSSPLRLALAGATRSGTAGVGSLARSAQKVTPHPTGVNIKFRPAVMTDRDGATLACRLGSDTPAGRALSAPHKTAFRERRHERHDIGVSRFSRHHRRRR